MAWPATPWYLPGGKMMVVNRGGATYAVSDADECCCEETCLNCPSIYWMDAHCANTYQLNATWGPCTTPGLACNPGLITLTRFSGGGRYCWSWGGPWITNGWPGEQRCFASLCCDPGTTYWILYLGIVDDINHSRGCQYAKDFPPPHKCNCPDGTYSFQGSFGGCPSSNCPATVTVTT